MRPSASLLLFSRGAGRQQVSKGCGIHGLVACGVCAFQNQYWLPPFAFCLNPSLGTDLKGSIFAYNDKESMSGYHSMRHWLLLHKSIVPAYEPFFRSSVRTVRD
jgi:ABC-type phosphate/phosphonate transport system substrate-binding protein